jgi:hypothetical protein
MLGGLARFPKVSGAVLADSNQSLRQTVPPLAVHSVQPFANSRVNRDGLVFSRQSRQLLHQSAGLVILDVQCHSNSRYHNNRRAVQINAVENACVSKSSENCKSLVRTRIRFRVRSSTSPGLFITSEEHQTVVFMDIRATFSIREKRHM